MFDFRLNGFRRTSTRLLQAALAFVLLSSSFGLSALPAAAATDSPSLTVSINATSARLFPQNLPWGSWFPGVPFFLFRYNRGDALTYQITVHNNTTAPGTQVCEVDYSGLKPRRFCYIEPGPGIPVSGVTVQDSLPTGNMFSSVSADSGLSCQAAGSLVSCNGGTLPANGDAHISIVVLPTAAGLSYGQLVPLDNHAVANPGNAAADVQLPAAFCSPTDTSSICQ